jgi:hypothetical protein
MRFLYKCKYAFVPYSHANTLTEEGSLSKKYAWSLLTLSVKNAILEAVKLNIRYFSFNAILQDNAVTNTLNNYPITWSKIGFEKSMAAQLVKKFIAICGTQSFITAFNSHRHLPLS